MLTTKCLCLRPQLRPFLVSFFFFFLRFYLFIFRGKVRKGGRKRGRETSVSGCFSCCPLLGTWACALTGNRIGNLLLHRPVLNPLSYTSQGHYFLFNQHSICSQSGQQKSVLLLQIQFCIKYNLKFGIRLRHILNNIFGSV